MKSTCCLSIHDNIISLAYKKDEGEVAEGSEGGDDDAEQHLHSGPGLGQLQHPHLKQVSLVEIVNIYLERDCLARMRWALAVWMERALFRDEPLKIFKTIC